MDVRAVNFGLFAKLPSTQGIDLLAAAGFDFCVVDLEHSQLGEGDAIRLLAHAAALGFPALARLPELDRGAVNRLLEAGAVGIQLSSVTRAEQVSALRRATRYTPEGDRSISLTHTRAAYGASTMRDYLQAERAAPPLVVAQVETATTEDPLEAILAAGPDVLFIGTADLAADLGLDEEAVARRVSEISGATLQAGVTLGAIGLADDEVRYRMVGADLGLLRTAAAEALARERALLERPQS